MCMSAIARLLLGGTDVPRALRRAGRCLIVALRPGGQRAVMPHGVMGPAKKIAILFESHRIVNRATTCAIRNFRCARSPSVIALCPASCSAATNVPPHRACSCIRTSAPSRKKDPVEKFPFRGIRWPIPGVGHWVQPAPIVPGEKTLKLGTINDDVHDLTAGARQRRRWHPDQRKLNDGTQGKWSRLPAHFRAPPGSTASRSLTDHPSVAAGESVPAEAIAWATRFRFCRMG